MQLVNVRRQPADYHIAKYDLELVSGLHWDDTSGGVHRISGFFSIYGYVPCNGMIEGELPHNSNDHCPHDIKVCILKKDNNAKTYKQLVEMVGPNPNVGRAKKRWIFWRWLRLDSVLTRDDFVGHFAKNALASAVKPATNSVAAWKLKLNLKKGTDQYQDFLKVWDEYNGALVCSVPA
jgi:hypothetical protein